MNTHSVVSRPGRPAAAFNPASLRSFILTPAVIMGSMKAIAGLPKALPVFMSDEDKTNKLKEIFAAGGNITTEILESLLAPTDHRMRTMKECAEDATVKQVEISAEEIRAYFSAIAAKVISAAQSADSRTIKWNEEKAAAAAAAAAAGNATESENDDDDDEKDAVPAGTVSDDDDDV